MKHLIEPKKKGGGSISVNQLLICLSKEKEHHVLINIHEKVSRVDTILRDSALLHLSLLTKVKYFYKPSSSVLQNFP